MTEINHQPLWIPLWDVPADLVPELSEEDAKAEQYHLANEATIAEVEALGG